MYETSEEANIKKKKKKKKKEKRAAVAIRRFALLCHPQNGIFEKREKRLLRTPK